MESVFDVAAGDHVTSEQKGTEVKLESNVTALSNVSVALFRPRHKEFDQRTRVCPLAD